MTRLCPSRMCYLWGMWRRVIALIEITAVRTVRILAANSTHSNVDIES